MYIDTGVMMGKEISYKLHQVNYRKVKGYAIIAFL